MEEVPTHVYLGPIVRDVLTRQHEHRSGSCAPDMSGSLVHVQYISLLEDFETIDTYNRHVHPDPLTPLGAMWCTSFDFNQLPMNALLTYRDQLDFMSSDQYASVMRKV
ncbi:hypothetical protein M9H77_36486 [Catharanthus roseus]|uniref:Uncharacterized protein n=1 Tax=Catharanthus roseus TaxID=4058 RepID=A0ACB9ZRX0_CATRO|nr:hypothetical protein M9H77_36486 [Catharanthus roseus]